MSNTKEQITGADFRRMIAGAYGSFVREHEAINNLNVFPVPDGDTGTNMLLTLTAVARAVADAPAEEGIGFLSRRAADSAIMGARGNSGVILSQIFRGIARGLTGREKASAAVVAKAFQYGILYAYRAVAKPVEGTILTVAKGIAKGAHRAVRDGLPFADILDEAIRAGEAELARTPELLPILKSAGVVDAGGRGLIVFLKGCLEGLGGGYSGPEADFDRSLVVLPQGEPFAAAITHPYCTEVIVKNTAVTAEEAGKLLARLGDSLVLAGGDGLLKVHIHTAHPGAVLEQALTWGSLHDIKIDNMTDQHVQRAPTAKQGLQVVGVVAGEGLAAMMERLGARIIAGGQSMNPPVEDFIDAVHCGSAQRYIILPNNKNILLSAAQAKKLLGDCVEIVPTTSVPQGLAAMLAFDSARTLEDNVRIMTERAKVVRDGGITVAVRDSTMAGRKVPTGATIGVIGGKVVADAKDLPTALGRLLEKLVIPESELITLYYGEGMTEESTRALVSAIKTEYANIEIEIYQGGQPHYPLLVSVE